MSILTELADVIESIKIEEAQAIATTEQILAGLTQETWVNALVWAWQSNKTLAAALAHAATGEVEPKFRRELTIEEWQLLQKKATKLSPALSSKFSCLGQRVTTWLPNRSKYANNALYEGRFEAAKKWMSSKKDIASRADTIHQEIKKSNKGQPYANMMEVHVRERDTRTKWSACK